MDEAGWEAKAYEQLGRILVAWGQFDHRVVSQTWKQNDPASPFPSGPVERTFYKRWCEWCKTREALCEPSGRAAFHHLREDVLSISSMRDDLAHGVSNVGGYHNDFCIIVTHWPKADWRTRFDAWVAKYAHIHFTKRPPPPQGGTTHHHYRSRQAAALLAAIKDAHQRIKDIGDATSRGDQFSPPSTPLTVPET